MVAELRFLARDAWRVFGWKVPLLIVLIAISGIFEGLALTAALPLLGALGTPADQQTASIVFLTGLLEMLHLPEGPAGIGALMLALIAMSAVSFLLQARLAAAMQTAYALRWQTTLFDATLAAGPPFLDQRRSGDVAAALVADSARVSAAFYHACLVLAACINFLVYLTLALLVSPTISAAVVGLGLVLVFATRPFMRRAYSYGEQITRAQADVQALADNHIGHVKSVKANAAEKHAIASFSEAAGRLARFSFASALDAQKAKAVLEFGGAVGIATVLIAGPLVFGTDVAAVVVVLALFVRLLPRFTALQQGLQALGKLLPALGNVRALCEAALSYAEPDDRRPLPASVTAGPPSVVLHAVSVRRSGKLVLDSVTVTFPAGQIAAIVGPSGSGKSTLVDAILGLVPLASGSITINGHALASLPLPAWRRAIGYVGQDTALMAGTVADNVRFGNNATAEQVEAALGRASAAFVDRLALGSATQVGDRGTRLSGGERQRIGLARALAVPRLLYILDEATSALDAETEAEVIATVAQLAGQATVIVVAHRFSAIRMADVIHVVEDGRIVESGRWEELDRPGTRFRTLRELQHAVPDLPAETG